MVRAHVTLCVLALLLQRVLEGRLAAAGRPITTAACLETLATCRLSRYEPNGVLKCDYADHLRTQEQAAIRRSLRTAGSASLVLVRPTNSVLGRLLPTSGSLPIVGYSWSNP